MIGRLAGKIISRKPPFLLIDVQGVGYEVEAPMSTFFALQGDGPVVLITHMVVREDAQLLYGFATEAERDLFRSLIKVSGIGPRMALAILSGMTASQFRECVMHGDTGPLVKLPGIGRKTAERLLIEMRDRLGDGSATEGISLPSGSVAAPKSSVDEAISALVALGYKPPEASRMIRGLPEAESLDTEQLIRQALKAAS